MKARERNDIIISWLTISAAFTFVLSDNLLGLINSPVLFPVIAITVGAGFVVHELFHRQVARNYGAHAEFVAWPLGLALAVGMGVLALFTNFGFLFAAPGAVYIYGPHITRKQNGIISLAGPASNLLMALVFYMILLAFGKVHPIMEMIGIYGTVVNTWLAVFNLLPIPPLDGSKIIGWSLPVWGIAMAIGLLLLGIV